MSQDRPKCGDQQPGTGLFYWHTARGKQRWLDAERFAQYQKKAKLLRKAKKLKDPEKMRENYRRYSKKYRQTHPLSDHQRFVSRLLRRIRHHLGPRRSKRLNEIIGCDPKFLRAYIEARFLPGMTWENRHLWHIDHVFPVSRAKTKAEAIKLCHYTNLQPLWAGDNLAKADKIPMQLDFST